MNIRVISSAPLTSRVFADGTSEALLLIDEPFPADPFPSGETGLLGNSGPQQFCVANSTSNCELPGTGGATNPYQSTENVFQGYAGRFDTTEYVEFDGVPIDPPPSGSVRIIRIANLRADVTSVALGYPVTATVSFSGSAGLVIPYPNATVAFVYHGIAAALNCTYDQVSHAVSCPGSSTQINVGASLGLQSAFETAVVTSNDQAFGGGFGSVRNMVGGTIEQQNIPGLFPLYDTESALTISPTASAYTGSGIGEASHGTWLMVALGNIPAGVQITAPGSVAGASGYPNPLLYRVDIPSGGWQFNSSFYASAPADKVVVDTTVPNPPNSAYIVYEAVANRPDLVESFNIPLSVVAQPGVSTSAITTALMFAPVPEAPVATGEESAWELPSTSLDIPRFLDGVPTLTGPFIIPGPVFLGGTLSAQFSITNQTLGNVTFTQLGIGCSGCAAGYPQFQAISNLTLAPGQSYQYFSTVPANITGTFAYFVEYQRTDGTWVTNVPGQNNETITISALYSLTIAVTGQGSVSANPPPGSQYDGEYPAGTYVCLTATPAAGWLFTSWSGTALDQFNCLTMNANTSVTANFVPQTFTLTLVTSPPSGGSLTPNPLPVNGLYTAGTYVCLTARPSAGWLFGAWSGAALDASNCLIVSANASVTAYFDTTTAQFSDVPPSATYFDAADLMFEAGVTTGCVQSADPTTRQFCPNDNVTREEMAAFIVRAVTGTVTPAIYNPTPYFQDVDSSNMFFPHIQKLMDLGITTGCSQDPPLYCPTETIPRWEMAMFMIRGRLMIYGASFNTSTTPYFADVPTNVEGNGMPFPFIQRSYDEHITNGCASNPLSYCPDELVTRGEMASFIMRGLFNETMVIGPTAPYLTAVTPNTVPQTSGSQIGVTISGTNTSFQNGDTVTVPSGMLAVSNIVVNSATSISATLTVNANAVAGPQALVVTTGGLNITLPLAIKAGTY
jgi:hypothetical protein